MNPTEAQNMSVSRPGIAYSISASLLFALMPAYLQLLPPMAGLAVIGQRIIWTTLLITAFLVASRGLGNALLPLRSARNWPGLVVGSLLVGVQWGLFVWAPLNGDTLGLAIGYFLIPLVLVLVGRLFLNEQLSRLQWLATGLAVLGVLSALVNTGHFSWVALAVGCGYPLYYVLRRYQAIPVLSAFFLENLLLLPLAWWACVFYGDVDHPFAYSSDYLMLFLGVGAWVRWGCYACSRRAANFPWCCLACCAIWNRHCCC